MKDSPKKKFSAQKILYPLISLLIGGLLGICLGIYLVQDIAGLTAGQKLIRLGLWILIIYAAVFIQLILHEGGHLVFGLLSGYRFSSFRIMSLMLVKTPQGLQWKKMSLAGTGGQCLLQPPEWTEKGIPVLLYNLGGPLMNLLTALLFFLLYLSLGGTSVFLLFLSLSGLALGLLNGIPMHTSTVDNDGQNALSLRKDPAAQRAFWIQMQISYLSTRNVRLKDMPQDYFSMPSDEGLHNSLVASNGVYWCNRLMDQHRFSEADAAMEQLLSADSALPGIYRNLMICDRIYCEILSQNREEAVDDFLTKEQLAFMKSMKDFPSVLRTEYAIALKQEDDLEKAGEIRQRFEQTAKSYPSPSDIQSERELMDLLD